MSALDPVLLNQAGKMSKRSIVCLFRVIWETAAWKLTVLQVVAQTVATESFARTRFVAAVAVFQIDGLFTFHSIADPYAKSPD